MALDPLALEALIDIRNSQPPKDRLHYFDVVLEGDTNRGTLIQKLYVNIISKSNIDFGKIPDSKGDLTKYEYYKEIESSISALNLLSEGRQKSDELELLNRLYDMIITLRSDYEFGYKFDIELIKITYNIAVMALFEMINICIMEYANYLRDVKGIDFGFKKLKKKDLIVIRGVKSLLKAYDNGEWHKTVAQFKKDPKNAFGLDVVMKFANKVPNAVFKKDANGNITGQLTTGAVVAASIVSVILLLLSIRMLIYFFYSASAKIDNYVRIQREFLEVAMSKDDGNNPKSLKSQEKMARFLDGVSGFIENKIFKTDKDAKKALDDSNKENFSKAEFTAAGADGTDIVFF